MTATMTINTGNITECNGKKIADKKQANHTVGHGN